MDAKAAQLEDAKAARVAKLEEDMMRFTGKTYHHKSGDQIARLRATLGKRALFSDLTKGQFGTVINAMQEASFAPGDDIITEGADASAPDSRFFVLQSGAVDIVKAGIGTVATKTAGECFGELALLYDDPRNATVRATEACTCWTIDRATFRNVLIGATGASRVKESVKALFGSGTENGKLPVQKLIDVLESKGLLEHDVRIHDELQSLKDRGRGHALSFTDFLAITKRNWIIERALSNHLVIPDFEGLCGALTEVYLAALNFRLSPELAGDPSGRGTQATYIPQLAVVDPDQHAAAVCTIDGQRWSIGDASETWFSLQACASPITYCMALEELGEEEVHRHIGREPSGDDYSAMRLAAPDAEGRELPHNPYINAGTIMAASLVHADRTPSQRFAACREVWAKLCGGVRPRFGNTVYLSERATADRNYCLAYMMREAGIFPEGTHLENTLKFYFQTCSVEVTCEMLSVVAGALANGGVCPVTGERVFSPESVRDCLSLMCTCGMYDYSGEFAFTVGFPAKSGVSGALLVVIPNVMGVATFCPRLDRNGNSVFGLGFCRLLERRFMFHQYDPHGLHADVEAKDDTGKSDPRLKEIEVLARDENENSCAAIYACAEGDLLQLQRIVARGLDLDQGDYDQRRPLHLAASEGRLKTVRYLLSLGADPFVKDHLGGTPLADAEREGRREVAALLRARMAAIKAAEAERDGTPLARGQGAQGGAADGGADEEAAAETERRTPRRLLKAAMLGSFFAGSGVAAAARAAAEGAGLRLTCSHLGNRRRLQSRHWVALDGFAAVHSQHAQRPAYGSRFFFVPAAASAMALKRAGGTSRPKNGGVRSGLVVSSTRSMFSSSWRVLIIVAAMDVMVVTPVERGGWCLRNGDGVRSPARLGGGGRPPPRSSRAIVAPERRVQASSQVNLFV